LHSDEIQKGITPVPHLLW